MNAVGDRLNARVRVDARVRRFAALAAMLPVLVLGGCDLMGVACTLELRPTIVVHVEDSVSGAPVTGAAGTITSGAGRWDADAHPGPAAAQLIFYPDGRERPGTYDVQVTADGYQPWTASRVRVTADECHVRTRSLLARMVSTP